MRTKCKRNHCSYSRRMLQGTAPLRSLSEKSENGCTAMTSLLNECCKTPQSKPLSEKNKNMRRSHGFSSKGMRQSAALHSFSQSPILPPSERAKSWRDVCRTARHKAKKLSFAKGQKANLISEYIPTAALSRYAEEKKREITSLSGSRQNSSVDSRSKKRGTALRRRFKPAAISLRRRQ